MTTLYDAVGGEAGLRAVISDFYDRVFVDVMIGFMFARADKAHLIEREYELVAALLGARGIVYRGRPMRAAHAKHTIFGGHFERRMQLLRETFADRGVPEEVRAAWLAHAESLRGQITRDRGSECGETVSASPGLAVATPEPDPDRPVKLGKR